MHSNSDSHCDHQPKRNHEGGQLLDGDLLEQEIRSAESSPEIRPGLVAMQVPAHPNLMQGCDLAVACITVGRSSLVPAADSSALCADSARPTAQ